MKLNAPKLLIPIYMVAITLIAWFIAVAIAQHQYSSESAARTAHYGNTLSRMLADQAPEWIVQNRHTMLKGLTDRIANNRSVAQASIRAIDQQILATSSASDARGQNFVTEINFEEQVVGYAQVVLPPSSTELSAQTRLMIIGGALLNCIVAALLGLWISGRWLNAIQPLPVAQKETFTPAPVPDEASDVHNETGAPVNQVEEETGQSDPGSPADTSQDPVRSETPTLVMFINYFNQQSMPERSRKRVIERCAEAIEQCQLLYAGNCPFTIIEKPEPHRENAILKVTPRSSDELIAAMCVATFIQGYVSHDRSLRDADLRIAAHQMMLPASNDAEAQAEALETVISEARLLSANGAAGQVTLSDPAAQMLQDQQHRITLKQIESPTWEKMSKDGGTLWAVEALESRYETLVNRQVEEIHRQARNG